MLLRIGDKIINRQKIHHTIDEILDYRSRGFSQQEIANRFGTDRTAISRIESLGEVRKGGRIALIGFPIKNCEDITFTARQEGVDYTLLLSERDRWRFVQDKSGVQLFNEIMEVIATLRSYDVVIILGSNMRIKLLEALLDKDIIGIEIGQSPIEDDKFVNPEDVRMLIRQLRF